MNNITKNFDTKIKNKEEISILQERLNHKRVLRKIKLKNNFFKERNVKKTSNIIEKISLKEIEIKLISIEKQVINLEDIKGSDNFLNTNNTRNSSCTNSLIEYSSNEKTAYNSNNNSDCKENFLKNQISEINEIVYKTFDCKTDIKDYIYFIKKLLLNYKNIKLDIIKDTNDYSPDIEKSIALIKLGLVKFMDLLSTEGIISSIVLLLSEGLYDCLAEILKMFIYHNVITYYCFCIIQNTSFLYNNSYTIFFNRKYLNLIDSLLKRIFKLTIINEFDSNVNIKQELDDKAFLINYTEPLIVDSLHNIIDDSTNQEILINYNAVEGLLENSSIVYYLVEIIYKREDIAKEQFLNIIELLSKILRASTLFSLLKPYNKNNSATTNSKSQSNSIEMFNEDSVINKLNILFCDVLCMNSHDSNFLAYYSLVDISEIACNNSICLNYPLEVFQILLYHLKIIYESKTDEETVNIDTNLSQYYNFILIFIMNIILQNIKAFDSSLRFINESRSNNNSSGNGYNSTENPESLINLRIAALINQFQMIMIIIFKETNIFSLLMKNRKEKLFISSILVILKELSRNDYTNNKDGLRLLEIKQTIKEIFLFNLITTGYLHDYAEVLVTQSKTSSVIADKIIDTFVIIIENNSNIDFCLALSQHNYIYHLTYIINNCFSDSSLLVKALECIYNYLLLDSIHNTDTFKISLFKLKSLNLYESIVGCLKKLQYNSDEPKIDEIKKRILDILVDNRDKCN